MQAAKPKDKLSNQLKLEADSYTISVALIGQRLSFHAYSDIAGKMFEAMIESEDIPEFDRNYFGDNEGVFEMLEDCVAEKRKIQLNDTGELKIHYICRPGKRNQSERSLDIKLKEVEVGEIQRLTIKIDRLETETRELLKAKDKEFSEKMALVLKGNEFQKIPPAIDLTTQYANQATINGSQIHANKGNGSVFPFFLSKNMENRSYFQVEISAISNRQIYIGVAAENLRNSLNLLGNSETVTLDLYNYRVYYENGNVKTVYMSPANLDVIAVKVDRIENTVEWEYTRPIMCRIAKIKLPASMREKNLFPVVHLQCNGNDKIKFV